MDGWKLGGWMGGWESGFKDCLQQSKIDLINNLKNVKDGTGCI